MIRFSRIQIIYLITFVLLNFALFSFSVESPPYAGANSISATYHNAADGQRYWGVAINIANKAEFSIPPLWDSRPEAPLVRSGPIPALIFSVPIKIFGFNKAPIIIVGLQCLLLYLTGMLSRTLASPYGANKTLIQGLIIFNPNLVGLAHHAQSDLIFASIFCVTLVILQKIYLSNGRSKLTVYGLYGFVAGLLCLTRPVGLIVSVVIPLILLATVYLTPKSPKIYYPRILSGLMLGGLIFFITILPWSTRNYLVLDTFSPTAGHNSQLEYAFERLLYTQGKYTQIERHAFIESYVSQYLKSNGFSYCLEPVEPDRKIDDCSKAMTYAYLNGMVSQPVLNSLYALIYASIRTLVTGGSSRLAVYLGVGADSDHNQTSSSALDRLTNNFQGRVGIEQFFQSIFLDKEQVGYLIIFGICTSFALFTRIIGLYGLIVTLKKKNHTNLSLFYILTILVYLVTYIFVSTSRFRAPLEPVLMLFATLGISIFYKRSKRVPDKVQS